MLRLAPRAARIVCGEAGAAVNLPETAYLLIRHRAAASQESGACSAQRLGMEALKEQ